MAPQLFLMLQVVGHPICWTCFQSGGLHCQFSCASSPSCLASNAEDRARLCTITIVLGEGISCLEASCSSHRVSHVPRQFTHWTYLLLAATGTEHPRCTSKRRHLCFSRSLRSYVFGPRRRYVYHLVRGVISIRLASVVGLTGSKEPSNHLLRTSLISSHQLCTHILAAWATWSRLRFSSASEEVIQDRVVSLSFMLFGPLASQHILEDLSITYRRVGAALPISPTPLVALSGRSSAPAAHHYASQYLSFAFD